jgi:hypothetical protein
MENQEVIEHVNKCKLPHSTTPTLETVSQRDSGWKIPTIVNGKTSNDVSNKKKPLRRTTQKSSKILHKVEVIGDSHLKVIASKINQYLSTKFKVCSLIKPGACTNQIVGTQENELMCLGKKDVIVINGGTNDTEKAHINPLSPELNPICYLLPLLAHDFLHVSRIRVKSLTLRLLMLYIYIYIYIYGAPILDVSRSHTTTQHIR